MKHLPDPRNCMDKGNLQELIHVLTDAPGQTNAAMHDVDVCETISTKQHAYRVNPIKHEYVHEEVEYISLSTVVLKLQRPL